MLLGTARILVIVVVLWIAKVPAVAQDIDWNQRGPWSDPWPVGENGWEQHRVEPFALFDNVHYVGLADVAAYLVTTPAGLILFNATHAETADFVLENIRALDFDPGDLEYVFVLEPGEEHAGGAHRIQDVTGAAIAMSSPAWDEVEERGRREGHPVTRDVVIEDGALFYLGGHAFKFRLFPGSERGAVAAEYIAYEPRRSHRAITLGGLDLDMEPGLTEAYVAYLESLRALDPLAILPSRPHMAPVDLRQAQRAPELDDETAEANLPVGRPTVQAWFDAILDVAREKLALERG